MTFTLLDTQFHVLPMQTRFPFQYGIASMTALPHLFVQVSLQVGGQLVQGLASEGLPPKWFTKNPDTPFEQDLGEMLAVIQNASRIAENAAEKPIGFFPWWQALAEEQSQWAKRREQPPLLANLGVSLIERAVLDGLAKAAQLPLHGLLISDQLEIDLGQLHGELSGLSLRQLLPAAPRPSIAVRHTIGLADPLRSGEVEDLNDGLPHSLEASIRAYGLRYFKIKVCGRADSDLDRLRAITQVLTEGCPQGFQATLDGNEQFTDLRAFRAFYEDLKADPTLQPLFQNLLFIEQPLHRQEALRDEVAAVLAEWLDGPGLIIDEADASLGDLPRALDLGYCGTSHKNCKGIVKGLANAALLQTRAATMKRPPILSGEDLANVGPVALLKDLAMMAALGISHVERNGHHYFRGLSMFPAPLQEQILQTHGDLYHRHPEGFATLSIEHGSVQLGSVNAAPLGVGVDLDLTVFPTLKQWIMAGGMSLL